MSPWLFNVHVDNVVLEVNAWVHLRGLELWCALVAGLR